MESIIAHLTNLRKLFSEATPTDPKVISDYAWTIIKALLHNCEEIDSITARQLLAECLQLPIERPSRIYSALLAAAIKVANTYPEFRFATFLRMWGIGNLRQEDAMRQQSQDGKAFPSLTERTAKALAHSLLLHPEATHATPAPSASATGAAATDTAHKTSDFLTFLAESGSAILPMLVTRIKEAIGKDGRKYHFVTLISPKGLEVETISHTLQPSPLHPLPEGKRHYANIGQLYNCHIRQKKAVRKDYPTLQNDPITKGASSDVTLYEAYLSPQKTTDIFTTEIGYIEAIDATHGHMHIYDAHSRHFVAPIQRFSKEKAGDFVQFIPIVPAASKFKTAIIIGRSPLPEPSPEGLVREIRITAINTERQYAAWELTDKTYPITEQLSPLQLSQGETSPTFTTGYLHLDCVPDGSSTVQHAAVTVVPTAGSQATVPDGFTSGIKVGQILRAIVYLKRGKDRQKRPHVVKLL